MVQTLKCNYLCLLFTLDCISLGTAQHLYEFTKHTFSDPSTSKSVHICHENDKKKNVLKCWNCTPPPPQKKIRICFRNIIIVIYPIVIIVRQAWCMYVNILITKHYTKLHFVYIILHKTRHIQPTQAYLHVVESPYLNCFFSSNNTYCLPL